MVKAKIGSTEIEGTPEEVAYILNGLLKTEEAPAEPVEAEAILYKTGQTFGRKALRTNRYRWRGKKVSYTNILGCNLQKWIAKNFPSTIKNEGIHSNRRIIMALHKAGVPYSISKRRLGHRIDSVRWTLKQAKKGAYTKDEVEDLNAQVL